jgi:hypothetical protein
MKKSKKNLPKHEAPLDKNIDPITGAPHSHPVATGLGATLGTIFAAPASIAGPVGTIAGATLGAVVGGLLAKNIVDNVNPHEEAQFWREHFMEREYYVPGTTYDLYAPAYRLGWEARSQYPDDEFEQIEESLGRLWESAQDNTHMDWAIARRAAKDAWDRVTENKH